MTKIVADRVLETSTTTGVGALTLAGAVTGYRAASAVCANLDTFDYYAEDVDTSGVPTGAWETGIGTWGTGNTLTCAFIASSTGSKISWAAGTRRVGLGLTAAGGIPLNTVAAATATQAGTANANFNVRWNWAKTTDASVAHELGESTAATGGTSTSGVPNQVLVKFSTLASSTMSPLSVYSRAAHVFSVSPSTAQILATNGSAAAPVYSFAGDATTGMYFSATSTLRFAAAGVMAMAINSSRVFFQSGSNTSSSITDTGNSTTGFFWPAISNAVGVNDNTDGEWVRWTSRVQQVTSAKADAVGYAINANKSRGTVASPTVITTGDDLLTISGNGYVGATNTYQEAAKITFGSAGTISDSATGIGGTIDLQTATVGSEPTSRLKISNTGEFLLAGVSGTSGQVLTSGGAGAAPTWSTSSGGGATLNGITAATANQAGTANANFNVRWNWAKTTDSTVAHEIGESAAATGGTSTSGVPNQVLAKFSTLAASTMSPLSVYSRAAHVFSVSPTAQQIVLAEGVVGTPILSFISDQTTGIYHPSGGRIGIAISGVQRVLFANFTGFNVSVGAPLTDIANQNSGIYWPAADTVGISVTSAENSRFITSGWQPSQASATAVAYAINARKARGTVASPTVITTGDELLTISGNGYVGATNTYQEAAKITFGSAGTISDSATGIGGTIDLLTATVGSEPTSRLKISNTGEFLLAGVSGTSGQVLTSGGAGAAPTWSTSSGGGATLNGITAATANQAGIANANFNVRWNWAKTTNTTVAMELGESAAATGGTSTSGVPNQVLVKFSTLAASTMSPLSVYSRGAHVFSVSPSTAQILAADGSAAAPTYSFAGSAGTGMYQISANTAAISAGGTPIVKIQGGAPRFTLSDTGSFSSNSAGNLVQLESIDGEIIAAYTSIGSSGGSVGSFRKSRGTVASPTVITTGDELLTIKGLGYVGATNTYQEAARITFGSAGTISDSATGIGGIIRFAVATVGGEPLEVMNITGTSLILAGTVRLKGYTVATLPAGVQGDKAFVTDALAPTYMVTVAGGGSVVTEIFFNGTNWICT